MNQNYIAVSIIFGSLLVAVAIFLKFSVLSNTNSELSYFRSADTHIYGNEKASIKIVEFSDFECPFCSRLHPTLKKIVDESNGEVSWEYRHLPLASHRNARFAAIVSECVATNDSRESFWNFAEDLFSKSGAINRDDIINYAKKYSLTDDDITECESDSGISSLISSDTDSAQTLGARGTPYSIIIKEGSAPRPVSGALPYESWINLINTVKNE